MPESLPSLSHQVLLENEEFVRSLARCLAGDVHAAEDAAQSTLLAALERSPPAPERTWLKGLLRNVVGAARRSEQRRRRREEVCGAPPATPGVAELVERMELHRQVVSAVLSLEEPYRSVVLLRFFHHLTPRQIAVRLEVPENTVKTRLKRALPRIRRQLEDAWGEDRDALVPALAALARPAAALGAVTVSGILGGIAMQTKVVLGVVAAAAITAGAFWISGPSTSADAPDPPLQAAAAPPDPAPVPAARTAQPEVPGAGTTTAEDSTTAVSLPGAGLLVHGTTLDPDGRPLEDVEVLVFDTSQDSMAAPLLASQRTTKDGAFRFDTLPFAGTSPRARLVCLHADRATTGLDFDPTLEIPLRVTLGGATTLEGSVVDAEGRAIAHARVLLSSVAAAQGSLTIPDPLQERLRAVTEDNGRFALPGLPRGQQVLLQVVADGYSSLTDQRALSPDSRSGPVEYVLLPEAVISGTVRYENGTPAAGLRVGCQTQDHFYSSSSSWGMAVTGEDGSYRVSGLGAGPWNVFVTLSDALQEEWAVAAHEGVALAEGQVRDGVDFTLTRGTLLVFRLIDASTKAPVPDVRVACYDSSRPRSGAAVHGATTGEDGTARMRVPAGPVYAYVMGLADGYLTPDGVREFEASDGETRELLFALQPATTVEGVVVDGEGTAIPGAWVYRMGTGRTLSPPGVRSAADGSFRLSGFVPGNPLMLRAETEALGMPRPLVLAADSEESRPVRLVLQPRPVERVRGRVLDLAALPASGAQVNLREMGPGGKPLELNPASPTFTTTADTDGRFSFSVWPGQEYRISAGALADREHDDYSILIGETETFLVEPLTDVELPDLLLRKLP